MVFNTVIWYPQNPFFNRYKSLIEPNQIQSLAYRVLTATSDRSQGSYHDCTRAYLRKSNMDLSGVSDRAGLDLDYVSRMIVCSEQIAILLLTALYQPIALDV